MDKAWFRLRKNGECEENGNKMTGSRFTQKQIHLLCRIFILKELKQFSTQSKKITKHFNCVTIKCVLVFRCLPDQKCNIIVGQYVNNQR